MARKARSNYIEAALQIFAELGEVTLSSKDLFKIAQERGLIGTTKYAYHNFLRKVRESDLFDASVRGQVSLVPSTDPSTDERPGSKTPDASEEGTDTLAAPLEGTPAAMIREILSADLPETKALDNVEDEEIDPDPDEEKVRREF